MICLDKFELVDIGKNFPALSLGSGKGREQANFHLFGQVETMDSVCVCKNLPAFHETMDTC